MLDGSRLKRINTSHTYLALGEKSIENDVINFNGANYIVEVGASYEYTYGMPTYTSLIELNKVTEVKELINNSKLILKVSSIDYMKNASDGSVTVNSFTITEVIDSFARLMEILNDELSKKQEDVETINGFIISLQTE